MTNVSQHSNDIDDTVATADPAAGWRIRLATAADAAQIAGFYRYYVEHTSINFEYEVPDAAEFRRRIGEILPDLPWLVAVEPAPDGSEDGERILGYLFAEPVSPRGAYAWSVKSSIYLDPQVRGRGIGSALYARLESILTAQHYVNLYAIITVTADDDLADITSPDAAAGRLVWGADGLAPQAGTGDGSQDYRPDPHLPRTSPRFHHKLGFSVIGREVGSGYKFGTWYDKLLMQKKLTAPDAPVEPILPLSALDAAAYLN
ncbi:GNAT family N-acetyltransferase [Bifidobacterium amazonense]|uniref:GNAT family N-acetyltransferase n=1 Tax=Bifidobacterium amazonense TaxID=2809027 RepID=A0ABS9VS50_9BIFI|nr:GNAT family N-acetyltransferase [Bifidobacterium amazonense]MCH9274905.1 GNAT family N-acetyltransferase [Bifidobacterium amazonense]